MGCIVLDLATSIHLKMTYRLLCVQVGDYLPCFQAHKLLKAKGPIRDIIIKSFCPNCMDRLLLAANEALSSINYSC